MAVGDRVSSKQDGEQDKMREILSSLVYRTSGWAGCGCNRGARWVPRGLASVDWPLTMNSSVISTIDIGRRVLFKVASKDAPVSGGRVKRKSQNVNFYRC